MWSLKCSSARLLSNFLHNVRIIHHARPLITLQEQFIGRRPVTKTAAGGDSSETSAAAGTFNIPLELAQTFRNEALKLAYLHDPEHRSPDISGDAILELEDQLNYQFRNPQLIKLALTHSSVSDTHNASMAWLGDAVLQLILTEYISVLCNGDLGLGTTLRNNLCNRQYCNRKARALGLDKLIMLGKSQLSFGPGVNMVAESFEAVLGAVYVDSGSLNSVRTCLKLPPTLEQLERDIAESKLDDE